MGGAYVCDTHGLAGRRRPRENLGTAVAPASRDCLRYANSPLKQTYDLVYEKPRLLHTSTCTLFTREGTVRRGEIRNTLVIYPEIYPGEFWEIDENRREII